jgi:hypothetical protein
MHAGYPSDAQSRATDGHVHLRICAHLIEGLMHGGQMLGLQLSAPYKDRSLLRLCDIFKFLE